MEKTTTRTQLAPGPALPKPSPKGLPRLVTVTCTFKRVLTVKPGVARILHGGRIRFICEQADVVVVAQHNLKGQSRSDQTPFANDTFTIVVPEGKSGKLAHLKDKEDLPRQNKDGHRTEHRYEYAVVAVSRDGKVAVADPIIIIR